MRNCPMSVVSCQASGAILFNRSHPESSRLRRKDRRRNTDDGTIPLRAQAFTQMTQIGNERRDSLFCVMTQVAMTYWFVKRMTHMTHYPGYLVPGMRRATRDGRLAEESLQPAETVVRTKVTGTRP